MTMLEQEFRLREARPEPAVMAPTGRRRGSRAGTWIAALLIAALLVGVLILTFATGGDPPADPGGNQPVTSQPASP
jgi:hypothetical protein